MIRKTIMLWLVLFTSEIARADSIGLIGTPVDEPTFFSATWSGTVSPGQIVFDSFSGIHWQVLQEQIGVGISVFNNPIDDANPSLGSLFDISTGGLRHITDPHPALEESGGATAFPLFINNLPSNGSATDNSQVQHGLVHFDFWSITATRGVDNFSVTITAQHVPEPSTLLLLGTGIAIFAVVQRMRRRSWA